MHLLLTSYCIIIMLTLMSLGIGLNISEILPDKYKSISKLFLSPVIGFALLTIYSIPVGYFVTDKAPFFIIAAVLSILLLFINVKKDFASLKIIFLVCGFMLVGSTFSTLFTALYYGQYNPFNDTWTYISQAQWLQSHPFTEKAVASGFYPAFSQVTLYQTHGSRVGPSFLLAITQSGLFLDWSYYAYPALLSLALGFGALASGGLIKLITQTNKNLVIFISLIIFIMPSGFVYGAYTGFYPMTFGLLFIIGLTSFLSMGVDNILTESKNNIPIIVISSLLFSAFLYSYNDYLPFLLLALSLSFVTLIFWNKNIAKNLFLMALFVLAGTLLLVNVEVKRIIRNLVITLSIGSGAIEIGWPIFWNPFEFLGFMSGLKSGFSGHNTNGVLEYLQAIFITVSVSTVLFYGLSDFKKSKYKTFLIIPIGLIFASAVVFIKMRYFTQGLIPNEHGATFLQLKTAKYASPFLIIILFSSLILSSFKNKLIKKYLPYILVLYLIASIGHNYVAMKNVHGDFVDKIGSRNSFEEILNLKNYLDSNLDREKIVYLDLPGPLHKLRQMVAYVLMDRKVSGNYTDDGYITGRIPELERNMPIKDANLIIRHTSNNFLSVQDDLVQKFGNLILLKNNPFVLTFISKIWGYGDEQDKSGNWNWTSKKIGYQFISEATTIVKMNFSYTTMIENSLITLSIFVNDQLIREIVLDQVSSLGKINSVMINNLNIEKNSKVKFVFESNKNGKKIGSDPRDLNFLIKNLHFDYE
jgi:hypothetical protein